MLLMAYKIPNVFILASNSCFGIEDERLGHCEEKYSFLQTYNGLYL